MNCVSKNLYFLRKKKELSQQAFADMLGITKSRIGAYEEGRSSPNIETLTLLSDHFKIPIDILVRNDLSKARDTSFIEIGNQRVLFPIAVDDTNENLIEVIPIKATAGYLKAYDDPEYIKDLDKIKLPFLPTGKHRAFPIKGDSMLPMKSGSFVVGSFVEKISDITNGKTYILVTKTDGLIYKRIYKMPKNSNSITLVSDNKMYSPYKLDTSEIIELWEFKCSINTQEYEQNELKLSSITTQFNELGIELKVLEKAMKQ